MTWTTACEFSELAVGMPVSVLVDADAVCVVRAGDEVFAVHDSAPTLPCRCPRVRSTVPRSSAGCTAPGSTSAPARP